jgi:hypothetical protein
MKRNEGMKNGGVAGATYFKFIGGADSSISSFFILH